jgi:hypothetical protein
MTTETSTPIVDTPADEPAAANKEVDAQPSPQLQSGSEAPSEVVPAAAEESTPALQENVNGDAPLTDEESSKKNYVDSDVVKTESPLVDSDEKQLGIKTDPFDLPDNIFCYIIVC